MGYDDDYIYVAGRFYYPSASQIQAASFLRDYWYWSSDFITITLNTFNDNKNGVVFLTTPVVSRTDANILNDADGAPNKNVNVSCDTFWDAVSVCEENVWYSEMRIPFTSLRFQGKENRAVMGLIASRYSAYNSETSSFPLIPQKHYFGNYRPSQTTEIVFEGIQRHNPLYVTPYVLGGVGQSNVLNDTGW